MGRIQQALIGVLVVRIGDHQVGLEDTPIGMQGLGLAIFDLDVLDLGVELDLHAHLLGHLHHALHDLVHAAHGVPGPQGQVGVVHHAVEGWGAFWGRSQEQHRKLQDLDQAGVGEVLAHVLGHAAEHLDAKALANQPQVDEFADVVRGAKDIVAHAYLVLVRCLG